ncbi:MAG: thrombospondin type 3 repeat-containing protein [Deltaproteobacteria bacterium]|nr:thrombospondin type 3 repeat-containing protein [Deltaproteobacteria bacterium]
MNATKPISIDGEANGGIKTPELFGGVYYNDASWKLYGGNAPNKAADVEIYKLSESDGKLSYIKTIDATSDDVQIDGSDFDLIINWAETLPSDTLRLILTDDANDTSEFSEILTASDAGDFLPEELASCAGSDWFWEANFAGNSDGDGLANGAEDINRNCAVDAGETDPLSDDSDFDGVIDSEDNCPLISNNTQSDIDSDGVGNACEAATPENGGGDAGMDDYDSDGIEDAADNCPTLANADQLDDDSDGTGNACEPAVEEKGPDKVPEPNPAPIPPPEPKPVKSDSGCTLIKESNGGANIWLVFMMILPLGIPAFAGMTYRKGKETHYGRR